MPITNPEIKVAARRPGRRAAYRTKIGRPARRPCEPACAPECPAESWSGLSGSCDNIGGPPYGPPRLVQRRALALPQGVHTVALQQDPEHNPVRDVEQRY